MKTSKRALIVIDLQNDYFPGGAFPLWNAEGTLANVVKAVRKAGEAGMPVILVQHVADAAKGIAPFFPLKNSAEHKGLREFGRYVLYTVNGYIDLLVEECIFDLFDKEAFSSYEVEGFIPRRITCCGDDAR